MLDFWDEVLRTFGLARISAMREKCIKQTKHLAESVEMYKRQQRLFGKVQKVDSRKLQAWSLRVRKVGKCDICDATTELTAHHLWDKATHPTMMYQDENGVCLCKYHHAKFHKTYRSGAQVTPAMYQKYKAKEQGQINIQESREARKRDAWDTVTGYALKGE